MSQQLPPQQQQYPPYPPLGYPPPPPQPPKKGLSLPVGIALIVAAAVVAILVIVAIGSGNSNSKSTSAAVVATATSVPAVTSAATTQAAQVQATTAAAPAPAATTAAAPAKVVGKVGDTVQAGGYRLTVNAVEKSNSFNSIFKPKAGNTFVAVDVTIESRADKGVSVNPFYAKMVDSQGYSYNFTAGGKDPQLSNQNDMASGEKMRGWITFEVPQSATGLKFVYSPISLDKIVITFDLGQ